MRKFPDSGENARPHLPGLAYILAFLIGVLLFLIFSEPVLGLKPEPVWIVFLMGLSISSIIFWIWGETREKEGNDD